MGYIEIVRQKASNTVAAIGGIIRQPQRKASILEVAPWVINTQRVTKGSPWSWNVYYDAMNHEWVNAAIGAIIMEILAANYNIETDDTNTKPNEDHKAYLNDLFQFPGGHNDKHNETYTSFMWKSWASFLGTGDAFIEVAPNTLDENVPAGMYYIPPHTMAYNYANDGWGYSGSEDVFESDELIHIHRPDIRNSVWGESTIDSIARGLTLDILALKFNKDFFKSGMHPRAAVQYDPKDIGETEYENEIERFKTEAQNNPRGLMFMYGGKFQDIALSNKDMEFTTLVNIVRDRILAVYGVPPQKVGIFDSGNLGSGRDDEADKTFWKKRRGEIKLFEDGFNNALGKDLEWDEKWRIGVVDLEDKKLRADIEDIRIKNFSKTVNEVRSGYNEPPVDWGDEPFIPQNYLPPVGNAAAAGVKRFLTNKGLVVSE